MSKKITSWKNVTKGKKKKKNDIKEELVSPLDELNEGTDLSSETSLHSVFVYGVSKLQDKEIRSFFVEQVKNKTIQKKIKIQKKKKKFILQKKKKKNSFS